MKKLTKTIATLFIVFAFALTAMAQTQKRYSGSFAKGVELFYQKDYAGAIAEFEKAEVENPGNHAAYLWHGLAVVGNDDIWKAHEVWTSKMPWDTKAKAMAYFFRGLAHWRKGETKDAKYWFDQNLNNKETPGYKLTQKATLALMNDEEMPPFELWATLAGLPGAKTVEALDDEGGEEEKPETKSPQSNESRAEDVKSLPTGVKPIGGLWRATITNGYKGQSLSFRVSSDGKTISDITFQGYLQCRGSRLEDTQLAPLKNVAVTNGAFADTQLNGGALVRFDFQGTFTSATTAGGTYRVMSDTDCDTYKLQWTASRVGN